MSQANERGAVAVEFALLAPVLTFILLGIMEFGRAYNTQATLTSAAREGVRNVAINSIESAAKNATKRAAGNINPNLTDADIAFAYQTIPASSPAPTSCAPGRQVTVTISYNLTTMTGLAGPFTLQGKGTMLCGG